MQNLIISAQKALSMTTKAIPNFQVGDTINISVKIQEGQKERIQQFQGVVIQIKGHKDHIRYITVRKKRGEIAIERIFPIPSAIIEKIEVKMRGIVRQSRIFYIRDKKGSASKIKRRNYSSRSTNNP
ncbi:MAG: 50S ribosomal protein L19 [Bacteroidota bacterium]